MSHSRRAANMNAEKTYLVSERLSSTRLDPGESDGRAEHDRQAWPDRRRRACQLREGITAAHAQHGRWIRQVEWSADRKSAILSGPGYRVTLSFDEQNVYARGNVPLAFKLLEGSMRRFVEQTLAEGS